MKAEQLCYDMKALQEVMPIGKSNLYNMVHSEGFPKIVIGRRILVPKKAFEEWLEKTAVQNTELQYKD